MTVHAFRSLRRSAGFAFIAILTLGLGIGASTTLFGVVNAVLIRPLPYRDADRLILVRAEQSFEGARQPVRATFPSAAVAAWPQSDSLTRMGFYATDVAALAGPQASELIDAAIVSSTFFDIVQGSVVLGRPIGPADDLEPAAVISDGLWKRRFAGSPDALGQQLVLNGDTLTVVGVMAETFQLPQPQTEVWIPTGFARARNPRCCGFMAIGRMGDGVSLRAVGEEIDILVKSLAAEFPRALGGARTQVIGLRDSIVMDSRPALLVLSAAVGLLLVLSCANVMNLVLARDTARLHEAAVRRALGASRSRLVAQGIAETALIAIIGTALGVAAAALSFRALKIWPPTSLPRLDTVSVDGTVVLFAFALAIATTLLVGLLPALYLGDPASSLNSSERRVVGGRTVQIALRAVTVAQIAIAMVLLVGAVLLGRSFVALTRVDIGVTPDRVATASLNLAMGRVLTDQQQIELVDRIVRRLEAMPDVSVAGVGAARPPDASRVRLTLNRSGDANARAGFQAAAVPATPGYFGALGIRLERGRFFTPADDGSAPQVVILSADTAGLLFGDQDALGRTIGLPVLRNGKTTGEQMTVVGIVDNVRFNGLDQMADAVVYRPFAQQPWSSVFVVARTANAPEGLVSRLQQEIGAVDRSVTISEAATLGAALGDAAAPSRLRAVILGVFSTAGIIIAAVGLSAVIGYSVAQRSAEIGIRMAVGASNRNIHAMVLREGLVVASLGCALGLLGSLGLTRLIGNLLYGVAPADLATFGAATAGIVGVGLVASYIPAARAARIEPLVVLRGD